MTDFSKSYFQDVWGEGYYEHFSYGVGIDKVFEACILPFIGDKIALEIGPGGGTFTELMIDKFMYLIAIDVIRMPEKFSTYENFRYLELPNQNYSCPGIRSNLIDFCFCYNVFCHLSNDAIWEYIKSVHRVLKPGGDFVFMLSNFKHTQKHVSNPEKYSLGDFLDMGHFYQDLRTLDLVAGKEWEIIERSMLPDHRDIIVHLKK